MGNRNSSTTTKSFVKSGGVFGGGVVKKSNLVLTSSFENKILEEHNKARNRNGLNSLVWDKALEQKALDWGKFLVQTENKGKCTPLRHPGTDGGSLEELNTYLPNNWGQNLYQASGITIQEDGSIVPSDPSSPENATKGWYAECAKYKKPSKDRNIPDDFMSSGHYTQLMWKDATKLGCARIPCEDTVIDSKNKYKSKGSMIVCDYDKGNIGGEFADQVPSTCRYS